MSVVDLGAAQWRDRMGRGVDPVAVDGRILWLPRGWRDQLDIRDHMDDSDLMGLRCASGKSNYYISKLLNQFWNGAAYTFPTTQYFGLWTASLTAASTGSTAGEIAVGTFTWYARVAMTSNTTNFPTSSAAAAIQNAVAITWSANNAGGNTSAVTFVMVADAATTGNATFFGSITSTTINTGDTAQININGLTASEA